MSASRPGRYREAAATYDRTRGASPTVVRSMARFLGPPEGRSLIDIGGGTGNYAQAMQARGFDVYGADVEPAMLVRSVPKIGPGRQVVADATALPFREASFDCAIMVLALHHIREPQEALSEARRILRAGPFVQVGFTAEQVANLFLREYFPGGDRLVPPENPSFVELERWAHEAGFARVESETFVYLDSADGSLAALHTDPLKLAGPAYLRGTSFFRGLPPEVQREGLVRLAEDLRSGVLERRVRESFQRAVEIGHGTVVACWP